MPIVNGAINLIRFRVADAPAQRRDWPRYLAQQLRKQSFRPLDRESGEEERSAGWVELHDQDSARLTPGQVFFGDDLMVRWRVDQVRVPPPVIKGAMSEWQHLFENSKQRKPTKREKSEEKELILRKLRKKAFLTTQTYDVRWRMPVHEVQLWATGAKVVDEILGAVEDSMGLVLKPLGPGARWEMMSGPDIRPTPELFGREAVSGDSNES
ncbi:MAG: recombination-associated protein RdgC [Myxococcales bacterium]|nr:recombination-associated protein RdgC [Myxococcales bacterium]